MSTHIDHGGSEQKALIRMYPSRTYFDITNPDPLDIFGQDIAHHLSLLNRFGGGTPQPYSVLSHSLLVANIVERQLGPDAILHIRRKPLILGALLHDATEAYMQDVNGLLKKTDELAGYREIETRLSRVIENRFGLRPHLLEDPIIKNADKLAFEMECSFVRDSMSYVAPDPARVRDEFYRRLTGLMPTVIW